VSVMTATVHPALEARDVRKIVFLVHRQRIHVRAQSDRTSTLVALAADHTNNTRFADTGVMLDARRSELASDDLRGAVLLEAELGMGVQIATQCRQLGVVLAQVFDGAHGQVATASRSTRSRGSTAK